MAAKKKSPATRKTKGGAGDDIFRLVFDNIQSGILIVDPENYTIIDANPYAVSLIGLPRENIVGAASHGFLRTVPGAERPITDLEAAEKGDGCLILTAKGEEIPVIKTVTRASVKGKEYLIKTFLDIRDRKAAEERKLTLIAFMNEAVARVKIPLGLTAGELMALAESMESGDCDAGDVKMQIRIHAKNIATMTATLQDLASRCARERDDIPEQFRQFIIGK